MRRVHYGDSSRYCWSLVTYKHLPRPRRCRKPKHHQGACWGGMPVDKLPMGVVSKLEVNRDFWKERAERCTARARRLRRWLSEARHQLVSEYAAAGGDDEAKVNPSLRARGKLINRIDKVLEETDG